MSQQPTIGRIVHYTLSEVDASLIASTRHAGHDTSKPMRWNAVSPGDTYPAVVVRTFGGPAANLKVLLDGDDTYWATSRTEGEPGEQGCWIWPPRV